LSLRACSSGLQVDRRGPVNVDVIRLKFSMEFPMIQKLLLFAAAVMPFSYSPVGAQTPQVAKPSLEFRLASDSATAGWKEMSAPKSEKTLFVSNDVALNGGHIDRVSFYKNKRGIPCVGLTMTDEGGINNHKKRRDKWQL